jgi:hypothetical protein
VEAMSTRCTYISLRYVQSAVEIFMAGIQLVGVAEDPKRKCL